MEERRIFSEKSIFEFFPALPGYHMVDALEGAVLGQLRQSVCHRC